MRSVWRRILFILRDPETNRLAAEIDRLREERAHSLFLAQKGLDKR